MELLEVNAAAIVAFIAAVISLFSFFLTRRTLMVETISKQRVDFITNLRKTTEDFLKTFLGHGTKSNLLVHRCAIDLWLDYGNEEYNHLIKALNHCDVKASDNDKRECAKQVIREAQIIMVYNWNKMKAEAHYKSHFEPNPLKRKVRDESVFGKITRAIKQYFPFRLFIAEEVTFEDYRKTFVDKI